MITQPRAFLFDHPLHTILTVQRWQKRNANCVKQQLPGLASCLLLLSNSRKKFLATLYHPYLQSLYSDVALVTRSGNHCTAQSFTQVPGTTPACSSANSAGILTPHLRTTSYVTYQPLTAHPRHSMRYVTLSFPWLWAKRQITGYSTYRREKHD